MNGAIAWFARNGVAANLLLASIMAAGVFTIFTIKEEVFPEFSADLVTIAVPYPGAAPEEVEEGICIKIEEEISGIDGIRRITSTAAEGVGTVSVEILQGTDPRRVLDDVKTRVDAIDTFPEEAESPIIEEVLLRQQVLNVAVHGHVDERTLKAVGERVRDDIANLADVSQVELANARPYEISVEVSELALRRHGLTFDVVADAVRRSSLDLPGGSLRTRSGEILVRTKGQAYRGREFEELVLLTRPDGTRLLLGDVARVVDGFEETDQAARFDGEPAVLVQVFRVGDQSALQVSEAVERYIARAERRLPAGLSLTVWQDETSILRSRLDTLIRNGWQGLCLVFLVLALFLRLRLAIWVSIGIPASFLGAIALMPLFDISMNLLSLFAFIVVLGIVVDDAIVVAENIYSHLQRGKPPLKAAIDGSLEVSTPVTFAVLTSIVAFMPMMFVPGTTGKIWRVIPTIVIGCLAFSLIESKLVLPSHLSHGAGGGQRRSRFLAVRLWRGVQDAVSSALAWTIERTYRPSLRLAVQLRYLTVAGAIAILLLTVGVVGAGHVKLVFMPPVEADYVFAALTLPEGTPADVTSRALVQLERAASDVAREVDAESPDGRSAFKHVLTSVGEQPQRGATQGNAGGLPGAFVGAHLGEVAIELVSSEGRSVTSNAIMRRWREKAGPIPGAVELVYNASLFSAGAAINVQLMGNDTAELRSAADELEERLSGYAGVFEIADSFRPGKQEIKLDVLPQAETLGVTLSDLARQVRQGFYGEEAQRIQRGRDDVKVMVRYPREGRASLGDLETMRVRTPSGAEVPFTTVARAETGRGYAAIRRAERQRAINVTADVDDAKANSNEILDDLQARVLPEILAEHPGVTWRFEGERREQAEVLSGLQRNFLYALLGMYGLLAVPFKSYVQPLVVMSAIPFGMVGAVAGHVLMGHDLSVLSLCGIVALAGVVVNDSLVLVDRVNRSRAEGLPILEAVREAGTARFRPILLTSLTTFAGLTPLLLEKSVQAQFLVPMGISLAFGVLFATFITLVLVPALYIILDDVGMVARWLAGGELTRGEPAGEEGERSAA